MINLYNSYCIYLVILGTMIISAILILDTTDHVQFSTCQPPKMII